MTVPVSTHAFMRGGFPLSGDPSMGRVSHTGPRKPQCTLCGAIIFGDAEYLPDRCPLADDKRHVYPNGEKAPELIYAYPDVPEGHIAFLGLGLTSATGHRTGLRDLGADLVLALAGSPVDPDYIEDVRDEAERLWRENVVAPIVRACLLPQMSCEYTVAEFDRGNPLRLTHLGGRDVRAVSDYEKAALFNTVWASFPQASLVHLASHYVPEAESGVPDRLAVPAYLAGLTTDEVATRHADGTLDPNAIATLHALKG